MNKGSVLINNLINKYQLKKNAVELGSELKVYGKLLIQRQKY